MNDRDEILKFASEVKGFLAEDEGALLFDMTLEAASLGPCLEIGSYCGKSAVYLGTACKIRSTTLFSIDHHRGSEIQQPGQPYFDPDILNPQTGTIDSFPYLLDTIQRAGLEKTVMPIVSESSAAVLGWATPLSLIFIDGGHSYEAAMIDYQCWSPHLLPGGFLVFHDVFPDSAKGGQAPYQVYKLASSSGLYEELPMLNTLGILRRYQPAMI